MPSSFFSRRQLGDRLDQVRLVDLVGDLGDDDLRPARRLLLLDHGPRAHDDAAAAGLVGLLDALAAVDVPAGREVRALDHLPELRDGGVGVVDQQLDRLGDFLEVVRRDVGRHADRDAGRAVDEQVRDLGGQDRRLLEPVVEVGLEVDGVLVDVLQHLDRDPGEPRLGVPVRRRRIAVDRAEVPLPVDQRIAQREVLHHAHQRVVDRPVAVRVILAQHVADHRRRLLVGPPGHEPELVHRVQDAAVHRLEAVAHVGERAGDDDAHRVVDERLLHLLVDEAGEDALARVGCRSCPSDARGIVEGSATAETHKYTRKRGPDATVDRCRKWLFGNRLGGRRDGGMRACCRLGRTKASSHPYCLTSSRGSEATEGPFHPGFDARGKGPSLRSG